MLKSICVRTHNLLEIIKKTDDNRKMTKKIFD